MVLRKWWLAGFGGFGLLLLGACSSSLVGQMMTDAGQMLTDAGNANAQVPSACKKWEVQRLAYKNIDTVENTEASTSTFAGTAITIPDGWEPFGGTSYGGSFTGVASQYLIVRRCVL
jgi:hypothetical protein